MSRVITLPHEWRPYPWQTSILEALEAGKKRVLVVAHRRAGKDAVSLNLAASEAHRTVGSYWHVFPFAVQGRKALWRGADDDGIRFIDQAFPPEIRKTTRDQEMSIEFLNGSVWQCVGSDSYNSLMGANPRGIVFSEAALYPDGSVWDYTRPILARNSGWAVFISTFRGRNWFYELYEANKRNPDWHVIKLDVTQTFDRNGQRLISDDDIDAERRAGRVEAGLEQILQARERAEADRLAIEDLLALRPPVPQIALLAEATRLMQDTEWRPDLWSQPNPETLEVRFTAPRMDGEAIVAAWEASPLFSDVTPSLASRGDGMTLNARVQRSNEDAAE